MGVFKYLSLKNNIFVYERKYPHYNLLHNSLLKPCSWTQKFNLALSKWSFKEILFSHTNLGWSKNKSETKKTELIYPIFLFLSYEFISQMGSQMRAMLHVPCQPGVTWRPVLPDSSISTTLTTIWMRLTLLIPTALGRDRPRTENIYSILASAELLAMCCFLFFAPCVQEQKVHALACSQSI